jgi:hypothetical protein
MKFLLPQEQLSRLSPEEQKTVEDSAFKEFLLGSIFGGRGIASGYRAVQNIIPNLQNQKQQQGLLQELGAINKEFFPTPEQEQAQALNANLGRPRTASSPYSLGTALGAPQANVQPQALQGEAPNYADLQTRLARLSLNPNAAQMIPALSSAFGAFKPNVTDGVVTDIRNRPTAVIPRADLARGLQLGGTVQGGNVNFNAGAIPGFVNAQARNELPPLATGQERTFDRFGNVLGVRTAIGAAESTQELEGAKAQGQASGQVEQVIGADGRTYYVPRSSLLTQPPRAGGAGTTPPVGGALGAVAKISPAQEAVNLATSNRYNEFTKTALDAALTVGDRKTSAEYLYNAAEQLDPNKLTEFFATGGAYIRAIPGVGDKFDSLVGNVNLLNKTRSEGVLKGLSNIKGNANAFEGGIVDKATTGVTDPKFVTKYVSALEIAAADKDDARQRFIDSYTGDPKAVYTAWANSPDNPRLYNHPKVNQFLNEQISANPSAPVLPAGFQLVQGKSGRYGVKKPDGTVMFIGQ